MQLDTPRQRIQYRFLKRFSPILLAFLMVILITAGFALASQLQENLLSWPIAALDGDQIEADIAYNPDDDNYLVAFVSRQGNEWSVYAQVLSGDGYVTLPLTPLAVGSGEERRYPAVAYNQQAGEFLVVWQETFLGQDWDIRGIRVTPQGAPIGDVFAIAVRNNPELEPDVAWDSVHNRYLVVWKQDVDNMPDISGQLLDALGRPIGSDFPVTFSSTEERMPQVAFSANGSRYLVVWEEMGAGADVNVRGQLLDKDGDWVGDVIDIATNGWVQKHPAVASGGNQFLVAWTEQPNSDHRDIVGQRYDTSGVSLGDKLPISTGENDFRDAPTLAFNVAKGAWLAVWEFIIDDADHDILGRYVQTNGTMPDDELIIAGNVRMQAKPATAAGSNDSFLIVWQEKVGDTFDLYAGGLGTPAGSPTPTPTVPPPSLPHKVWLPLVDK